MTIVTVNQYFNKRGAYMGEKNPENDKKAERFGWTLKTITANFYDPEERCAEWFADRKREADAWAWINANRTY